MDELVRNLKEEPVQKENCSIVAEHVFCMQNSFGFPLWLPVYPQWRQDWIRWTKKLTQLIGVYEVKAKTGAPFGTLQLTITAFAPQRQYVIFICEGIWMQHLTAGSSLVFRMQSNNNTLNYRILRPLHIRAIMFFSNLLSLNHITLQVLEFLVSVTLE